MRTCLNCLYAEHCHDVLPNEDFPCDDFKDKNDYQKVVHAKWEYNTSIGKDCKCSNCYHEENFSELTDYCSSCGARMDLE